MASSLTTALTSAPYEEPAPAQNIKPTYRPHLDGLRALALFGVLIEHFGLPIPDLLRFGPLSVRFFFVLSGYFITVSLWKIQNQMAKSDESSASHLGRYYLARLLRIGPPFYLALTVGAIFGIEEVRTNFLWLATFQANTYINHLGYWPNSISHFWSLAVQEQFYLLWPIVVLTLPRRWFAATMTGFVLFGLLFRIACIETEASTITRWVTLFGCIDSFAIGALVAYFQQSRLLERIWSVSILRFAMPLIAFACFFIGRALMTLPEGNVFLALTESCDAVFLAWLLAASLSGFENRYSRMLSWAPIVYIGRISYGIYVYHVFVIILVSPLLVNWGLSAEHLAVGRLAILLAISVALASLSWHFMEKPFLSWKARLAQPAKATEEAPGQASFA